MKKSKKPDYTKARKVADLVFDKITDHKYPVNTLKIIYQLKNIKISTYEDFAIKSNCNVKSLRECSPDAFTVCKAFTHENKYVILYNSEVNTVGRIRFSIAHELGHIFLGHFNEEGSLLKRGGLPENTYKKYEVEANTFANELLIPPCLLNEKYKAEDIYQKFDVSKQAAEVALEIKKEHSFLKPSYILCSDLKNNVPIFRKKRLFQKIVPREENTVRNFKSLIISYKDPSIYVCKNCLNTEKSYYSNLIYCPACGSRKLIIISKKYYYIFHELIEEKIMKYPGLKVNTDGRLEENCPICENEDIKGDFCSICGTYLVNVCSGDHKVGENQYLEKKPCIGALDGSDRFCPYCGALSTFFENGLLEDWDTAKNKIQNLEVADPFSSSNL